VSEISELCINGEELLYEWAKKQAAKIFTVNTQQPVVLFLAFEERRNGLASYLPLRKETISNLGKRACLQGLGCSSVAIGPPA